LVATGGGFLVAWTGEGPGDRRGVYTRAIQQEAPTLSTADVTVTEGDSGQQLVNFDVSLSSASLETVTVDFATTDDSAIAGQDYEPTSGTVTFTPGSTMETIQVAVLGDTLDEPDEAFALSLTNASHASIAVGQATGTVQDNDPEPSITISDVTVTEGDTAQVLATFDVTLSAASDRSITVDFATCDGTTTSGLDDQSTTGTLTFETGSTQRTIQVTVLDDTLDEADDIFVATLTNAFHASIADSQGTGAIEDNDPEPSITINDVAVTEGNTGQCAGPAIFARHALGSNIFESLELS